MRKADPRRGGGLLGRRRANRDCALPPFFTGFVNGHAFAVIFPIAMRVAPYGAQLAHRLNKRQLEIGFAVFLLFVSVRFFWSLVG